MKTLKELIIFTIKLLVYGLVFGTFFVVFSTKNVALTQLSRTMVITMTTFLIVGVLMLSVYGNFRIGEEKSRPVIYSAFLAVALTDVATYIQLMIMNTSPANNLTFKLEFFDLFFITLFIQLAIIIVFAYVGNYIYFSMHRPNKTLIVYDSDQPSLDKVLGVMARFKKQYRYEQAIHAEDPNILSLIETSDFVVFLDVDEKRLNKLITYCYAINREFVFESSLATIIKKSGEPIVFDDKLMFRVRLTPMSIEQRLGKRLVDIVVSAFGLIITLPILVIAAIAIKVEDQGTVFFKQERYTVNGKIFKIIKFRSMKKDVANYSVTEHDERITKVGRVLRKTRIDELPQLLNVLKGDMSLVGPRPEMLENVHHYEVEVPEFRYRLKVKAGITGLAQIEGKYNTTPMDKLLMDLMYIENYSTWYDLKLMLRTLNIIFKKDSTAGFYKVNQLDEKNKSKKLNQNEKRK